MIKIVCFIFQGYRVVPYCPKNINSVIFLCVKVIFGSNAIRSFCDSSSWGIILDFLIIYLRGLAGLTDPSGTRPPFTPQVSQALGPGLRLCPRCPPHPGRGFVSLPLSDMTGLAQAFTCCSVQARVVQIQHPWKISVQDLLTVCSGSRRFKEITYEQAKCPFPCHLNDDFIFNMCHTSQSALSQ